MGNIDSATKLEEQIMSVMNTAVEGHYIDYLFGDNFEKLILPQNFNRVIKNKQ